MAFRKKAARVLNLNPDLLIIPECECEQRLESHPSMPPPRSIIWKGHNQAKGIGILSYSDFDITSREARNPAFRYVVPIEVSGSKRFNLLAIWAMNDTEDRKRRYIGQVWLALQKYAELLDDSVLIVGDFNWNRMWDDSAPNLYGNFTETVEFLQSKGIVSLYHAFYQEALGKESRPTLYMNRKADRPYHVDYCFASADLAQALRSVEVGRFADWNTMSDHMPLTLTFDL